MLISAASHRVLQETQGMWRHSQPQTHRHLAETLPGKYLDSALCALSDFFFFFLHLKLFYNQSIMKVAHSQQATGNNYSNQHS